MDSNQYLSLHVHAPSANVKDLSFEYRIDPYTVQVVDLALIATLVEAGHAICLENDLRDYHAAVYGLGAAAAAAWAVHRPLSDAREPHENSVVPPTTG